MKAIVETATGKVLRVTPDTDGCDLEGCTVLDAPEGYDAMAISHVVEGGEWVINRAAGWSRMREERAARLAACDWTQLPDVPEETRLTWQAYRQALRDLPDITADPFAPEWPKPPLI